jgi:hypothetical protein
MNLKRSMCTVLLLLGTAWATLAVAAPVGSSFTYQGSLLSTGSPVSGDHDFVFSLFDDPAAGNQVGVDQNVDAWPVTGGLFTVALDFGPGVFDGTALWLEIKVRGTGSPDFVTLTPRQPLTAAPYALYALSGTSSGGGASQWISNGADLTYSAGGVGILGGSSPFAGGKGVFLEGGSTSSAQVFAFNYDTFTPLTLALNSPGGSVGVGTSTPAGKFDVVGNTGVGIRSTIKGSLFAPLNAAVVATGNTGTGISGTSALGVYATSVDDRGVMGVSTNLWGVSGDCLSAGTYGILGTPNEGLYAYSPNAAKPAGHFVCPVGGVALQADGIARVKTLQITGGADLAERFVTQDAVEPGTVMAIDPGEPGRVRMASGAYSRTVAGVASGANALEAGVVLSRDGSEVGTVALALTGRVWVKCDATRGPIRAGDLLTTADRAGYAMRVTDHDRAQGAVLGKAMSTLERGTGLVLVLVSLQ